MFVNTFVEVAASVTNILLLLLLTINLILLKINVHTPNANMADGSVVARDESHEGEASQSLMLCFYNASQESLAS